MTPERKAEIRQIIYGPSEAVFEINAYEVACELLSEVDRLEGELAKSEGARYEEFRRVAELGEELARYREEPSVALIAEIATEASNETESYIQAAQARAVIEAYRSAVK